MVKRKKLSAWSINNLREVKKTLGRFLAIMSIVALGVGFFAGLRVTQKAMLNACRSYVARSEMYDLRLISTLGLTDDDVAFFGEQDGVISAEGSCFVDFLYDNKNDEQTVLTANSITTELNLLNITEGRMPSAPNECAADALRFDTEDIGTTVKLSSLNDESTLNSFAYTEYTITGLCTSVSYFNIERGTTSLGNGSVSGFIYIPRDGFALDYNMQIFLTLDVTGDIYSDEYNNAVSARTDAVYEQLNSRAELRQRSLYEQIDAQLLSAQDELDAAYASYNDEKASAEEQLAEAYQQLVDAYQLIIDGEGQLEDSEAQLAAAREQYYQALSEYNAGLDEYNASKAELDETFAELQSLLDDATAAIIHGINTYGDGDTINLRNTLEAYVNDLNALLAELDENDPMYDSVQQLIGSMQDVMDGLDGTETVDVLPILRLALLDARLAQGELNGFHSRAYAQLDAAKAQLDDAKAQLDDAYRQIKHGEAEIESGRAELDDAKEQYAAGMLEFEQSRISAMKQLRSAKRQLDDAQAELDAAKDKAYSIVPDLRCYTLDRRSNSGYACFESDSGIVSGISKVFPVFFFLVAALVCSSTMTRMVDEQRTLIGTYKALGYSHSRIVMKYIGYAGGAALLGCGIGYFFGLWLFPYAIWAAYGMLYNFGPISYVLDTDLAVLSVSVSLLCSVLTAWIACRNELAQMPAVLMRPKSPKAGKRVLLERIPFIWNRLRFLQKVSIRNIMRYKKRLFMMLLGISGCTALILTGFGIGDCISHLADDQFDEIMLFDYWVSFNSERSAADIEKFAEQTDGALNDIVYVTYDDYSFGTSSGDKQVYIVATGDSNVTNLVGLYHDGEQVPYPSDGTAILSNKAASLANISIGDTLTVKISETETRDITISGIFDNHIYNFIYMTDDTYAEIFNTRPVYKMAFASCVGDDYYGSAKLVKEADDVESVLVVQELRDRVSSMMTSMNYVVLLVILCASALALVVIYNLTYINITERAREIATKKVLGFYPKETYSYVFRENVVLTVLGAAIGLPMGTFLLRFVMSEIRIDMVSFNNTALPLSYVYAVVISIALTYIVNLLLRSKINKIDMADSLKSVE